MIFCKNYKTELKDFVLENKELFTLLKNKSILITGAAGLIASYMIDLVITANETLSTNCKVYAVDLDGERLKKCFPAEYDAMVTRIALDVNETEVDIDSADYVIHAASNTSPLDYALKPVDTMRTNVIGTDNLIRFALNCGAKRFLFCIIKTASSIIIATRQKSMTYKRILLSFVLSFVLSPISSFGISFSVSVSPFGISDSIFSPFSSEKISPHSLHSQYAA